MIGTDGGIYHLDINGDQVRILTESVSATRIAVDRTGDHIAIITDTGELKYIYDDVLYDTGHFAIDVSINIQDEVWIIDEQNQVFKIEQFLNRDPEYLSGDEKNYSGY